MSEDLMAHTTAPAPAGGTEKLFARANQLLAALLDISVNLPTVQSFGITVGADPADNPDRIGITPGPSYEVATVYNVAVWAQHLQHLVTVDMNHVPAVYFEWTLRGVPVRVHAPLHGWRATELANRLAAQFPGTATVDGWQQREFDPAVVMAALAHHPAIAGGE